MLGLGVVAFPSAPTFAVWCLAFLNAKPAWHEGGMENDMNAMLEGGLKPCKVLSDFAFASRKLVFESPYARGLIRRGSPRGRAEGRVARADAPQARRRFDAGSASGTLTDST